MNFLICAVLVLLFNIHKGHSLQCWTCSSDIDRTCADMFNLTDFTYGAGLYQAGYLSNPQPYDPYNQRPYDNRDHQANQNENYRTTESYRNYNSKDPHDRDPPYSGSNYRDQNHDYRRPEDREFRDRPLEDRDRNRDPNYRGGSRDDYPKYGDSDSYNRNPNYPYNRSFNGSIDKDVANRNINITNKDYPYNSYNDSYTSNHTRENVNPDPWANRDRYYSNQDPSNNHYENKNYNNRNYGSRPSNGRDYYDRNPSERGSLNNRDPNRDRYNVDSRDYNYRDPNNPNTNYREPSTRDPNNRDVDRDYNNRDYRTRDYNSRDPLSRDPLYERDRNRDPYNRDYNNRDVNARSGTRDPYFDRDNRDPYNRDPYNRDPNNRDYPPRDVNRDYNQQGRSFDPNYPPRDYNYQRAQALSSTRSGPRLVTCDEDEARLKRMRNVCIKKVQRIGEHQLTYIRRCETIPFEKEIGTCYDPVSRGISLDFCEYCERDGCNSAPSLKFNFIFAGLVPMVLLRVFFL